MRIWTVSERWMRRGVLAALLALAVAAGIGFEAHPLVSPAAATPASDRYSLRDVITGQKAIALTFDISWGTVMPDKVLAVLVMDHAPATFFLSGPWAKTHPDYVKRLVRDGFEVESHGWAHVNYSALGYAGVVDNISRANQVLRSLTGKPVTLVRPPNGDFNRQAIAAARSLGYTVITWGTDSLDWMNPGVNTIIRRVLKGAHSGDIVLLHASDTCKQTNIALPGIIKTLRTEGYRLVTVQQLLKLGTPNYRG
jgi:polysaccharide deacetylase family sporulation protein PdaB